MAKFSKLFSVSAVVFISVPPNLSFFHSFLHLKPMIVSRKMHPLSCSPAMLLTAFFFFLAAKLSISLNDAQPKSIYDVLQSNGLPIGLLPDGVGGNYSVDEQGRFEVHIDRPCNTRFEDQVHYERNITGTLSYGRIRDLSGVSSRELFLWFPVKGIIVDAPSSGFIYFDVGVIKKLFSLSLFETPLECTAGDAVNGFGLFYQGKRLDDALLKVE